MTTDTLQLTCQTPNKRPTVTDSMRLEAARVIVADMIKNGLLDESDPEGAANDIADVAEWGEYDGFRLARDLELRHHWDCDMQIAEALDSYHREVQRLVDAAVKVWAAENPMTPLPTGTAVTWRGKPATIEGVSDYRPHSYLLKNADSKPESHWIVAFEDVVPA